MFGPEPRPDLRRQRVAARAGEVGDRDRERIEAPAGPARGDDADLAPPAEGDQQGLEADAVDRVDDDVEVARDERFEVLPGEEVVDRDDLAARRHAHQALAHRLHLALPDGVFQRVQLAVEIAGADVVVVYHRQVTDSRPHQRLGRPGTDATEPDHAEAELPQQLAPASAVDAGQRGEGRRGEGWHVYILRCADGTLYTGITTDPERRLREHNGSARGASYTRGRRPVTLVWREKVIDRRAASVSESRLKRLSRLEKERLVASGSGSEGGALGVQFPEATDRG